MKILAQFPTFARPEKFLHCLRAYINKTSGRHKIFFNINCDADDKSMNNQETVNKIQEIFQTPIRSPEMKWHDNFCGGEIHFDKDTTKISSINAHVNREFDIAIVISDDMIPKVNHWDDEIATAMIEHYPDLDGCISFNDGYSDDHELITFSILGKKLYEHFGYIYHPDYKSLYCDSEFTKEVAKLNKITYIDKMIIKHEHYSEKDNSNSGYYDMAAEKTLFFSGRDEQVFEQRKKLGFPRGRITQD